MRTLSGYGGKNGKESIPGRGRDRQECLSYGTCTSGQLAVSLSRVETGCQAYGAVTENGVGKTASPASLKLAKPFYSGLQPTPSRQDGVPIHSRQGGTPQGEPARTDARGCAGVSGRSQAR